MTQLFSGEYTISIRRDCFPHPKVKIWLSYWIMPKLRRLNKLEYNKLKSYSWIYVKYLLMFIDMIY